MLTRCHGSSRPTFASLILTSQTISPLCFLFFYRKPEKSGFFFHRQSSTEWAKKSQRNRPQIPEFSWLKKCYLLFLSVPVLWTQIFCRFHMHEQLFLSKLLSTSLASSCKQEALFASVRDLAEIITFGPHLHHSPVSSARSWEVGQGAQSARRWSTLPPQHSAEKGKKAWAANGALFYEKVLLSVLWSSVDFLFF